MDVTEDEIRSTIVGAERWAKRLLRRRWEDVEKLAGALLESGRLTGGQVARLLRAAS
jgi:hypothetical protein